MMGHRLLLSNTVLGLICLAAYEIVACVDPLIYQVQPTRIARYRIILT